MIMKNEVKYFNRKIDKELEELMSEKKTQTSSVAWGKASRQIVGNKKLVAKI